MTSGSGKLLRCFGQVEQGLEILPFKSPIGCGL
jgi:hypothetical protein